MVPVRHLFCQLSLSALLLLLFTVDVTGQTRQTAIASPSKDTKSMLLPLTFEENRGQADPRVLYLSHSQDGAIFFTRDQVVLPCTGRETGVALTIEAAGNAGISVRANQPTGGVANYYKGQKRSEWIESIPLEQQIRYEHVADGIDLVFHGKDGKLEYDVEVAAGADPTAVSLGLYSGLKFALRPDGSAVMEQVDGRSCEGLRFRPPVAYQTIAGKRVVVNVVFALDEAGRLGFSVRDYDRDLPLTIDPVVAYTKIIGVNNSTSVAALAVDASGDVFLAGSTMASNYPVVGGSGSIGSSGSEQVYVTKLDPTGSQILYSTYLPAAGFNSATAIALDSQGNAYVAGINQDPNFPTTSHNLGTCTPTFCNNGFVVKVNGSGGIVYSTQIGSGQQLPRGIVVDEGGNAYIAGSSVDAGLPAVNAFQGNGLSGACTNCGGPFFAKLNPTGTAFVFASYFYASGFEQTYASAIALDAKGNIYLAGPGTCVPLKGSLQNGIGGSFAAEFGPDGKTLIFSTLLGGTTIQTDYLTGMQVGPDGTIYLAGAQIAQDFPYTSNAFLHPIYPIGYAQSKTYIDAVAINPGHTGYTYATYLGQGWVTSTAVDAKGDFFIGGTFSLGSIPLKNALVSDVAVGAYILELDPTGSLVNSTAFGGYDVPQPPTGMAVDADGNIYVAGAPSIGGNINIPSASLLDPISVGTGSNYSDQMKLGANTSFINYSTFVAKISPANEPQISLSYQGPVLELRNVGSADLLISSIQLSGGFTNANSTCGSTVAAGTACFLTPSDATGKTANGTITINSDASPASQSFTPLPLRAGNPINSSIFIDTSQMNFPPQQNGGVSAARPLRIWNTGLASTTIQSILPFGYFQQTNDCSTLAPQTFCTVQVSVAPVSGGTGSTDIGILYGNSGRTDVSGFFQQNPTDGPLLLSADSYGLNYGNILVGQSSVIRTLTVTNSGNSPVSVADPAITGTGAASFLIAANSCSGILLQPQQSCVVSVQFQSSSTGRIAVPMTIFGGGYSNTAYLVGTGVTTPSVSVVSTSGGLGNVVVGYSASQVFQVTNTGAANETVSNIVATLADASFSTEYSEQDTCQAALAPQATCSITVIFTPQSVGTRNGLLNFSVNGGTVSQSIPLTAAGITAFSASPGSVDFGTLLAGGPGASVSITLTNQSAISQPFTAAVGNAFQLDSGSCVSPLAAGAQCVATVSFQPASVGPQQSALTVSFTNSPAPLLITLTGVGGIPPAIQLGVANHAYGDAPFLLNAVSNSTGAITYSVISGPATISGSTVTLQGAGTVILQASQAAAGNYSSGKQNASFTVAAAGTKTTLATSAASVVTGTNVTFTATVASNASGASTGSVQFLNGTTAVGTVQLSGGTAAYTTNGLGIGSNSITAVYSGDSNFVGSSSAALIQIVTAPPDFSVSSNASTLTIKQGQSGTATLTISPINGFSAVVSFACSGLPSGASCSFSPTNVTPSGGPVTSQVTIATQASTVAMSHGNEKGSTFLKEVSVALGVLVWLIPVRRRRPGCKTPFVLGVLTGILLFSSAGCGGNPTPTTNPGTPVGSSQVRITTTSGTGSGAAQHSITFTITVTS
jgi:hypothetical protein